MVTWEAIKDIEYQFSEFENHSMFFIRERLYKGGKSLGNGLRGPHEHLVDLIHETGINPPNTHFLEHKTDEFVRHVEKLKETLELLEFTAQRTDVGDEEILRFISIIEMEIKDIEDFFVASHSFDPRSILSEEELSRLRIGDLKLKIEDNFNQITMSSEWKRTISQETQAENANYQELITLIEDSKQVIQEIEIEGFLEILSRMATKIRDLAAQNVSELPSLLLMFATVSSIFKEELVFEYERNTITCHDVKDDIELRLNLSDITWLSKVHESIIEDDTLEDFTKEFAILLYVLSRNKREELKWGVKQIVKERKNERLNKVSDAYDQLLSIVLQVNDHLLEIGSRDISEAIITFKDTDPLDLIDINQIMFSSRGSFLLKLIEAINNQLESLKDLALQLIQMDDIRQFFTMITQFNTSTTHMESDQTVENYINSLGK